MMNNMVCTMYNPNNNYSVFVYQKSRTEFRIKIQIGHNSYYIQYVWGLYESARTCFCYLINGYQLINNQLGHKFAFAVHAGEFSEFIEPDGEPLLQARCSPFRTAY